MGIELTSKAKKWGQMYTLLCEFWKEHHRWPMTKEAYHGMPLGSWCGIQRYKSKEPNYPADRRKKMEDIGFLSPLEAGPINSVDRIVH